jgi:hypothetical protein
LYLGHGPYLICARTQLLSSSQLVYSMAASQEPCPFAPCALSTAIRVTEVADGENLTEYVILSRDCDGADTCTISISEHVASGLRRASLQCDFVREAQLLGNAGLSSIRPFWIRNPGVDSRLMLSAFLWYLDRAGPSALCESSPLPMIMHRQQEGPFWTPPALHILQPRVCIAPDCRRCRHGRGGYTFKWVHSCWLPQYLRLTRDRRGSTVGQPSWHVGFQEFTT